MKSIKDLKEELKEFAIILKLLKGQVKNEQRVGNFLDYIEKLSEKDKIKFECRHKHIAYGMLKGRKYEEIENSVTECI